MKLDAKQLRRTRPTPEQFGAMRRNQVYIILDNVLDTYNVGAIFRIADAVAATEVILCGGTETPPSSRIHKAAVGTQEWVKWRYFETARQAIEALKKEVVGIKVVAVEQDEKAISLQELNIDMPFAIVVGHETNGVTKEAIEEADVTVEIPMWGVNKSLNVMVSTGIVLYKILSKGGI